MKKSQIEELTDRMDKAANDILEGRIELETAKQYFNGTGKVLGALKVQQVQQALFLAYKTHGFDLPNIPYLENQNLGGQKCLPK